RIISRAAGHGSLPRGGNQDELRDEGGIARQRFAAKLLSDDELDSDDRAYLGPEARGLDPEVVRRQRRGEQRRRRERRGALQRGLAAMYCERLPRSALPPESTTPTRRPEKSAFLWRTAAAAATPEGSTRTFMRSSIHVSVSINSSSETTRISLTFACTIGNVRRPGDATRRPSAIVGFSS